MRVRRGHFLSRCSATLVLITLGSLEAQGPHFRLDSLDRLTPQAAHVVNITLNAGELQKLAASVSADQSPTAKKIIDRISSVSVRSLTFGRDGVFGEADLRALHDQLQAPWSQVFQFTIRNDRQTIEAYSWPEGEHSGALVAIAWKPRELTVVSIVGQVDLSDIGTIQRELGLPAGIIPDLLQPIR
jgi:Domain of unknown function (DUF4252)